MMSFKEWLASTDSGHVFIFYPTDDLVAAANAIYLIEGGRNWQIDNQWSVRFDRAHAPNMQDHVHIMQKGNEISVINRDGSQSHGTTREAVPNWLIYNIKKHRLIESVLIVEVSGAPIRIPPELIGRVHRHARLRNLLPM